MTSSVIEDRDKLISEYEKLIDRLEKAEKWASDNNYCWEFVKASKYKIWHERDNIIKEIEFVRELLKSPFQVAFLLNYIKLYGNNIIIYGGVKMKSIIKVQSNSKTVSVNIPKHMVEKMNLKKGDRVLIELKEDNSIVIKNEY